MTRRTLLSLLPAAAGLAQVKRGSKTTRSKTAGLPPARGEFIRFADRITENVVVRLTLPQYSSLLPAPENRFVSRGESFLVFSSNRTGPILPYRADLRTGIITPLAQADALKAESLALDARDRELLFVDGDTLKAVGLPHASIRTIADDVSEFHLGGRANVVVVRRGSKLERITAGESTPVADNVSSRGLLHPSGTGCIFGREEKPGENELWYASFAETKPRLLAKGKVGYAHWRPDGQAVLFLRQTERPRYIASELREVPLDGSPERLIAETSQFAAFAPNADGSVFVGASRSKAQPVIVLLLRTTRREMVLCEHRARQAELVSPAFSPNSQRVYFQSDHEGKFAIYSVNVDRLVEQTQEEVG